MGYNPDKPFKAGRSDYVILASAGLVTVGLIIWALLG